MTDDELADAVIHLGVGHAAGYIGGKVFQWDASDESNGYDIHDARSFVRDWRVAGALMEKIHNPIKIICCEETYCVEITVYSSDEEAEPTVVRRFDPNSRSRAINEACVEVLQ